MDLRQLIAESVDSERALANAEKIEFHLALSDEVNQVPCDRQLVSRVMVNLLSNAIKHTPSDGTITVTTRKAGSSIVVEVADTGSGIPREYQQRIFEKFGQVDQPDQERRGTGLGLPFCRMAVEAHGGQIGVESQAGQGSTFFFRLPLDMPVTARRSSYE